MFRKLSGSANVPTYQPVPADGSGQAMPTVMPDQVEPEASPPKAHVPVPVVALRLDPGGHTASLVVDLEDPELRRPVKTACILHLLRKFPNAGMQEGTDSDTVQIKLKRGNLIQSIFQSVDAADVDDAVQKDLVGTLQWLKGAGLLKVADQLFANQACAEALIRLVNASAIEYNPVSGVRVARNLTPAQLADLDTLFEALAPIGPHAAPDEDAVHVAIALLHSAVLAGQAEDESALVQRCVKLHGRYPHARLDERVLSGLAGVVARGLRDPATADACASLRDDVLITIFDDPKHGKLKFFARPLLESRLSHMSQRAAMRQQKRPDQFLSGRDDFTSPEWQVDVQVSRRSGECDEATAQWLKRLWMSSNPTAADREWAMQMLSKLKGPHAHAALLACKGMEADEMMAGFADMALEQLEDKGFMFELDYAGEFVALSGFDAVKHGDLLIDYAAASPQELRAPALIYLSSRHELTPQQATRVLRLLSACIELECQASHHRLGDEGKLSALLESWNEMTSLLRHADPRGHWQGVVAATVTMVGSHAGGDTAQRLCDAWFALRDHETDAPLTVNPLLRAVEIEVSLLKADGKTPANLPQLFDQGCAEIEKSFKEAMAFLEQAREKNPRLTLVALNDANLMPASGSMAHALRLWETMVKLATQEILKDPAATQLLDALVRSSAAQMLRQAAPKAVALIYLRLVEVLATEHAEGFDAQAPQPLVDALCDWLGKWAPKHRQLPDLCAALMVRALIEGPSMTYPEFRRGLKLVLAMQLDANNDQAAVELAVECMTLCPLSTLMLIDDQDDVEGSRLVKRLLHVMIDQHLINARSYSTFLALSSNPQIEFDGITPPAAPAREHFQADLSSPHTERPGLVLCWRILQQMVLDKRSLINDPNSALYKPLEALGDWNMNLLIAKDFGRFLVTTNVLFPILYPIYLAGTAHYSKSKYRLEDREFRGHLPFTGDAAFSLIRDLAAAQVFHFHDRPPSLWKSLSSQAYEALTLAFESPVFEDGTAKPPALVQRHMELAEMMREKAGRL